jgi:hypothetical protein
MIRYSHSVPVISKDTLAFRASTETEHRGVGLYFELLFYVKNILRNDVEMNVSKKRRSFHINHECRIFQVKLSTFISHIIFFIIEGHTFDNLSASLTKTVGNTAESHS